MVTLYKWRIYCITEGLWTYGYSEDGVTGPTVCYTNNAHQVNTGSVNIDSTIENLRVEIVQQSGTNQNYRVEARTLVIPANSTASDIHTWPYDICPLALFFNTSNANQGDIINSYISPETAIGYITANASIDDTVLNVSSTVPANIQLGFLVFLDNGTVVYIGEVCAITDTTITLSEGCPSAFSLGSLVRISMNNVKDFVLQGNVNYELGKGVFTTSFLKKNVPVEMRYKNNSNTEKNFYYGMEYFY